MIKNIQYLRFLAAALVVLAHSNLQIYGINGASTNLGGFGVDIFFIISGFIMPYIIYGGLYTESPTATMGAAGFLWRRITRIWPMYFITIACVIVISYAVGSGFIPNVTADLAYIFNPSKANPLWVFETLTFTHWSRPPVLGIGWTLQVEFLFYVSIAAVLLFRVNTLAGMEAGILSFFFLTLLLSSHSEVASAFANPMIFEFMLGFFLYRIVSSNVTMNKNIAIFILAISAPALLAIELSGAIKLSGTIYRPVAWGVPAFFLVWAALSLEQYTKDSKIFSLLGDASYSLYLTHGFISPLFVFIWISFGLADTIPWWIYLPLYFAVCQGIGVVAHLYVEKPINNSIRKIFRKKPKCATA
ncbi:MULTISPECIES: acyltransferase family protein [unclassified Pseudomonas]|uniref:acyltransferase family protein n=1 Tax=unclassified Pseudomonas TaxID=196821 RepID=UPI0035C0C134